MNTRAGMETELREQLLASNNSSLFPSTRLTQLIQDAYLFATGAHEWQALVKGKNGNTQASLEYYNYPSEFGTGSLVRLEFLGEEYDRKNFEDYLDFKLKNPTSTKKIFSSYARQFFMYPIPTVTGTGDINAGLGNLNVWGPIQADALDDSTDTTIFSGINIMGNEAVVRKAFSVAMRRVDPVLSRNEEEMAIKMLNDLFMRETKGLQRDQRLDHPKFNVPNFFSEGSVGRVGRFSPDAEGYY